MKKWIGIGFLIVILVIGFLFFEGNMRERPLPTDIWEEVRANDVAQTNIEWDQPVYIEVSDGNWEDSVFISKNGRSLFFTYYPGENLIGDISSGNFKGDLDVYVSQKQDGQFVSKETINQFYLNEDPWSAAGPMIDSMGNIFYHSNHQKVNDISNEDDIYMNEKLLGFNKRDIAMNDPHYCEAKDELYYTAKDRIWIVKDAKASNFVNSPELVVEPINPPIDSGAIAWQPFLTEDCLEMYFLTNRGEIEGIFGPAIYYSKRTGKTWSKPIPVVWSKIGVGEPSMPVDKSRLYFVQLFQAEDGRVTSDMFYVERN